MCIGNKWFRGRRRWGRVAPCWRRIDRRAQLSNARWLIVPIFSYAIRVAGPVGFLRRPGSCAVLYGGSKAQAAGIEGSVRARAGTLVFTSEPFCCQPPRYVNTAGSHLAELLPCSRLLFTPHCWVFLFKANWSVENQYSLIWCLWVTEKCSDQIYGLSSLIISILKWYFFKDTNGNVCLVNFSKHFCIEQLLVRGLFLVLIVM